MTPVLALSNIGLQFRGNFCNAKTKIVDNKAGEFSEISHKSSCNTYILNNKRRFSLLVRASFDCSPWGVSTINGREHMALIPHTAIKLANESTTQTTFDPFLLGVFVEDKFVYRQSFIVRSYEIGPDKTVTIYALMNFLQETAINNVTSYGVSGNNFATTREMDRHTLIWVANRIQIQVQKYSKWGDKIDVDTWFHFVGKNGMRRDSIIRDHCTKEIIARATSTWAMMNKETRRLSKLPESVKQELFPFRYDRHAISSEEIDCQKIHKLTDDTAETIRSGMTVRRNDMDANQHVNNVKYISWILESVPREVLDDYDITSMTLEFRRECTQSSVLESMTSPSCNVISDSNNSSVERKHDLQYTHLLRLQDNKAELVRGRTKWRLRQNHK
ncbi:palmitoyl-acyl carrier protein thioesterase, chloroplastic-like [Abrus precatorius]|uniref:Acyl-[acyl-carrier-protein] hydrolase n=1 Tax=Abrus precatorius TaxID=3816 RepID=A0A8B8LWH1_ABRPR|nr:palmitoyl-acyl carrier protein thioesterase, chloroplastic-like [Abrus precatorius]